MKGMKSNGSDASDPKPIGRVTIDVTGYDTSLPEDNIKSLMKEHFSLCGKITRIYFLRGIRDKSVFVEIVGDDAKEKALTEVTWEDAAYLLRPFPPRVIRFKLTPGIARRMADQNEIIRQQPEPANVVVVEGFDPRLHHDNEIKGALVELFSSCGEMVGVCVHRERIRGLNNKAIVRIRGDGVADKAWKLSGRDVGGWKANVVYCSPSFQKTYHRLPSPRPKRTRK